MLSSTGARFWTKVPMAFPNSSSVLDKVQSAKFYCITFDSSLRNMSPSYCKTFFSCHATLACIAIMRCRAARPFPSRDKQFRLMARTSLSSTPQQCDTTAVRISPPAAAMSLVLEDILICYRITHWEKLSAIFESQKGTAKNVLNSCKMSQS